MYNYMYDLVAKADRISYLVAKADEAVSCGLQDDGAAEWYPMETTGRV